MIVKIGNFKGLKTKKCPSQHSDLEQFEKEVKIC